MTDSTVEVHAAIREMVARYRGAATDGARLLLADMEWATDQLTRDELLLALLGALECESTLYRMLDEADRQLQGIGRKAFWASRRRV